MCIRINRFRYETFVADVFDFEGGGVFFDGGKFRGFFFIGGGRWRGVFIGRGEESEAGKR